MQISSPFADNGQMKALHPRFRFHTGDWLTRHLVVTHCQAISRSFARLGEDPDLKILENYRNRQKRNKQKESQKALKNRRNKPYRRLLLPKPKVSVPILHFQQVDVLGSPALLQ